MEETITPPFVKVTPFGPYCVECNISLSVERGIAQHTKSIHPANATFNNAAIVRAVKLELCRL